MTRFLLFLCLISLSCTKPKKKAPVAVIDTPPVVSAIAVAPDHFVKGKVIASVNLRNDSSQQFALYLPESYTDSARFPVIIFFDPHSKGTIPLNLYKDLAEKYHYVLLSSNTSKNGMDFLTTSRIADNLIDEAVTRFSVSPERITLCGFSGGAKVALSSGTENRNVSTIIYCGAAIPVQPSHPVRLLGFAGRKDMNYTDLVSFEKSLKDAPFKHYLVEWKGSHEFPSAEAFRDAFIFLNTGAIPEYDRKQVRISPEKINEEQSYKQKYIEGFQVKDLEWWKKEIHFLEQKKKSDVMYERLLGFISLACYSMANNALRQNDLPFAEKVLVIYKMADPENEAVNELGNELNRLKGMK